MKVPSNVASVKENIPEPLRLVALRDTILDQFVPLIQKVVGVFIAFCLIALFFLQIPRILTAAFLILLILEAMLLWIVQHHVRQNKSSIGLWRLNLYSLLIYFMISVVLQIPHFFIVAVTVTVGISILNAERRGVLLLACLATVLYAIWWLTSPVIAISLRMYAPIHAELPLFVSIILSIVSLMALSVTMSMLGQQLRKLLHDVQQLVQHNEQLSIVAQQSNQKLLVQLEKQERLLKVVQTLEVPIVPLRNDMIVVPLLSYLDVYRMEAIEGRVLAAIEQYRSRIVILELTGVPTLDQKAASRLIHLTRAIGLLGAQPVLTGLHPDIALALSKLGVDLSSLTVFASIQDVLSSAVNK